MSKLHSHKSKAKKEFFSEDEILKLEDEFVQTYLKHESHPYRTLWYIYKRYWKELSLSMFFYLIALTPSVILPVITANIINLVADRPDNVMELVIINTVVIVLLLLLNIPTNILYVKYHSLAMRRVEAGLRGAMVRKLQQLSISFQKEMRSGRIQSKLMRDVETVQSLSSQLFYPKHYYNYDSHSCYSYNQEYHHIYVFSAHNPLFCPSGSRFRQKYRKI